MKSTSASDDVLSYGAFVPKEASLELHSAFEHAVNYAFEDIVVSFVAGDIGSGPSNIVLKRLPAEPSARAVFSEGRVFAFGREFSLPPELLYDSRVLVSGLDFFFDFEVFPEKSMAFLLEPPRERFFTSAFEKAFVEKARSGFSLLKKLQFKEGSIAMAGLGGGLTPAGDDFLTGLLSALHLIKFSDAVRRAVYERSKTKNALSNTFLKAAYEGHFYEPLKNFLDSPSAERLERVLGHGFTSGADMLSGLIFGLSLRQKRV